MFTCKIGGRTFSQSDEISKMEKELGVEDGLLSNLLNDNDFTFTIKSYAIIESSINVLLCDRLMISGIVKSEGSDILQRWIEKINLTGRAGKIELCRRSGLIKDSDYKFANTLIVVRNNFAHRPQNFSRSILEISELEESIKSYFSQKEARELFNKEEYNDRQRNGIYKIWLWLKLNEFVAWCNFHRRPFSIFDFINIEGEAEEAGESN